VPLLHFEDVEFRDIRNAVKGDKCPKCSNGTYELFRGIEVGHIFKLGTKYSEKLNATYLDKDGKERLIVMGCYGIGIGRTAAAAIEQNHDEDGMILPEPISPFKVYLLPVNYKDDKIKEVTDTIYEKLNERNIEVLLDDRDERPGKKFKDADLLGFPYRITVGKKAKDEIVELIFRKTKDKKEVKINEIFEWIK